jgi:hypothetical protein
MVERWELGEQRSRESCPRGVSYNEPRVFLVLRSIVEGGARGWIAGRVSRSVRWERPYERVGPQRMLETCL